jgi:hypothetical protein
MLVMSKYPVGSRVRVLESAGVDVAGVAWPYLNGKVGTVRWVETATPPNQPGVWAILYSIEFPDEFRGGWDAFGHCLPGKGQQISQQHLEILTYDIETVTD